MKLSLSHNSVSWIRVFIVLVMAGLAAPCLAQDNSWTSPVSGNWEDAPSWSLGLPATNQTLWLTNYGWKAVQIGSGTAANFPQSLNVNSIVISSPTNSFNSLVLNYVGANTPLTLRTMSVGSNSAVTMNSSALQINGPSGEGMTIGGEFNQNDSVVGGNQINVGYNGPGIYNFTSGYLAVSQLWLGGQYGGVLNQTGGTNAFGITHLDGGNGNYVLSNGFFGGAIYFDGGGFQQYGGWVQTNLTIFRGSYLLAGGLLQGGVMVPSGNGWTAGGGSMLQTGGTNDGSLAIGSYGYGTYTMSNGVSFAGTVSVGDFGAYSQWDGIQTISGGISIAEDQVNFEEYEGGEFNLYGGQVSSSGIYFGGYYTQTGGTNMVAGNMTMQGYENTTLRLSDGLLAANNVVINPGYVGGVYLTGGTLIVTNTLWLGNNPGFPYWEGFNAGGRVIVSDISMAPQSSFSCGDGVINQSGTLTLANASVYAGSNTMQFGRLCLSDGGNTNSTLYLPSGASLVHFADSSSMTWSNDSILIIANWSGSLFGGGAQQIIFGNSSTALIAAQFAQIQFQNPAGLAAGTYPARILSSGEIVPDTGRPTCPNMALKPQSIGMQVTLQGEPGRTYSIEVSTDLVHWVTWTNQTTSDGRIAITDTESTHCPARFYRAKLEP
ncbi:MAG TPA: hypothetical protein VH597_03615 [Verrucomicrobiae bacterium]|jgi:hypothetical protein|nr:hypothetical protein [Verrucomicrobiae bacterium]